MKISRIIPVQLRKTLLQLYQHRVWHKAIREFKEKIYNDKPIHTRLLRRLVFGWGNQGFSAQTGYLQTCIQHAMVSSTQPILECGSGLTTVLLGIVAERYKKDIVSLEDNLQWAERVRLELSALDISRVQLNVQPLVNYGKFFWYAVTDIGLSGTFGLIICDGPPAQTPGGRYGLLPVMKKHLGKGSVILMDDTIREDEQAIIKKWQTLLSFDTRFVDGEDQHAVLTING